MARKSRRNKSTEVNISQDIVKNKNLLDTAAYVRLSVENGGNETDETLVVQQMLVEKYIEELTCDWQVHIVIMDLAERILNVLDL